MLSVARFQPLRTLQLADDLTVLGQVKVVDFGLVPREHGTKVSKTETLDMIAGNCWHPKAKHITCHGAL